MGSSGSKSVSKAAEQQINQKKIKVWLWGNNPNGLLGFDEEKEEIYVPHLVNCSSPHFLKHHRTKLIDIFYQWKKNLRVWNVEPDALKQKFAIGIQRKKEDFSMGDWAAFSVLTDLNIPQVIATLILEYSKSIIVGGNGIFFTMVACYDGTLYSWGNLESCGHTFYKEELDDLRNSKELKSSLTQTNENKNSNNNDHNSNNNNDNGLYCLPESLYGEKLDHPRPVLSLLRENIRVRSLACGSYHTLILTQLGHVYSFGFWHTYEKRRAFLGRGEIELQECLTPGLIQKYVNSVFHSIFLEIAPKETDFTTTSINPAIAVAAGANHSLVLLSNGDVYSFGANDSNQLGLNLFNFVTDDDNSISRRINGIDVDLPHKIRFFSNGELGNFYQSNVANREKNAVSRERNIHLKAPPPTKITGIAAGETTSLFLTEKSKVFSVGMIDRIRWDHRTSNDSESDFSFHEKMNGNEGVKYIFASRKFFMASTHHDPLSLETQEQVS